VRLLEWQALAQVQARALSQAASQAPPALQVQAWAPLLAALRVPAPPVPQAQAQAQALESATALRAEASGLAQLSAASQLAARGPSRPRRSTQKVLRLSNDAWSC
jgi:hypothetical protein